MNTGRIFSVKIFVIFFLFLNLVACKKDSSQFTLMSSENTGVHFVNDLTETQQTNILTYEYAYNGGGVAVGDVNGDDLPDIYFSGNTVSNQLYLNKGNWKFEDVTESSKTKGRPDWKTGVTMVDVNGDGWLDIYVCYSGNAPGEGYNLPVVKNFPNRANELFVNQGCAPGGTPVFKEEAKKYGVDAPGTFSTQAYFFDYDLDGDLDLFLLNHANMFYAAFFNTHKLRNLRHPYFGNKLFRNDNQKFIEVSQQANIHGSGLNFGLSASISDLNFDGWPDLYVTNDFEEQDFCYINQRNGTFKEASHTLLGHLSKFGMGSDIADINNDGLQDIIVLDMLPEDNHRQKLLRGPDEFDRYNLAVDSGYHHQYMRNTLQLNRGFAEDSLPRFSEIGQLAGLAQTDWSWAPLVADFDNDGRKDIFITNGFFRDFTNLDFMKYTGTVYQEAKIKNQPVHYLDIIQQLPVTQIPNYFYKNVNGIQFSNVSREWGTSQPSISNGGAYADFDADGDYDLVVNNLGQEAFLFKNNQQEKKKTHFVKIKLKGKDFNSLGLGAKIYVVLSDCEIFQEVYFTRGYQSSVEPVLTLGLGDESMIKKIKVVWPDGNVGLLENVKADQYVSMNYSDSRKEEVMAEATPNQLILQEDPVVSGIDFIHQEDDHVDFKTNRLWFYQLSRLGGNFSVGDVNGDENDDVFFGGASNQMGQLYLGQDDERFYLSASQPWKVDQGEEDAHSLFFDADGDGDLDLYVVSGGLQTPATNPSFQDRLYLNLGNGDFIKSPEGLPSENVPGSCVVASDFDQDGDLDLFVGGRHAGLNYPYLTQSFILRNESQGNAVKFVVATDEVNADLKYSGMVTDALWTDFNKDSWPDLLVVGEFMPVTLYINQEGKLKSCPDCLENQYSEGWWTSVDQADVDGDGDMDYLLGNLGDNFQIKASEQEPVEVFAGDFNQDGRMDPFLCYYIQGKSYPLISRDELFEQINGLQKKFLRYEDYADASLETVTNKEFIEKAVKYKAYHFSNSWMENNDGKTLKIRPLPLQAQFSSTQDFLWEDFDGDGQNELLGVGNFFSLKPQLGRLDASFGFLFSFEKGKWREGNFKSKLWMGGDIRQVSMVHFKNGNRKILLSRNNGSPGLYRVKKK